MADDPMEILAQARAALKAGEPHAAVRAYRRAQQLLPRDPEVPHERGLAHLEAGDVGLAALAQAETLALDPEHTGARAQRAAALEALGDDEGAAREWDELLHRTGPMPALQARYIALGESARRSRARRLLGNGVSRLPASPLASSLARSIGDPHLFKAPFAELRGTSEGALLARLDLVFESMDSSMGRSDLTYGGATEDEQGRRVPLDEFTAAGTVFLAEALGIEPLRARRMLSFLLTPECGLGPHKFAGCKVGWTVAGDDGQRRYGLFCET
jgi:tetratricopeptide (TPR) repeat protein